MESKKSLKSDLFHVDRVVNLEHLISIPNVDSFDLRINKVIQAERSNQSVDLHIRCMENEDQCLILRIFNYNPLWELF